MIRDLFPCFDGQPCRSFYYVTKTLRRLLVTFKVSYCSLHNFSAAPIGTLRKRDVKNEICMHKNYKITLLSVVMWLCT